MALRSPEGLLRLWCGFLHSKQHEKVRGGRLFLSMGKLWKSWKLPASISMGNFPSINYAHVIWMLRRQTCYAALTDVQIKRYFTSKLYRNDRRILLMKHRESLNLFLVRPTFFFTLLCGKCAKRIQHDGFYFEMGIKQKPFLSELNHWFCIVCIKKTELTVLLACGVGRIGKIWIDSYSVPTKINALLSADIDQKFRVWYTVVFRLTKKCRVIDWQIILDANRNDYQFEPFSYLLHLLWISARSTLYPPNLFRDVDVFQHLTIIVK